MLEFEDTDHIGFSFKLNDIKGTSQAADGPLAPFIEEKYDPIQIPAHE